jgi:hypothetical protein
MLDIASLCIDIALALTYMYWLLTSIELMHIYWPLLLCAFQHGPLRLSECSCTAPSRRTPGRLSADPQRRPESPFARLARLLRYAQALQIFLVPVFVRSIGQALHPARLYILGAPFRPFVFEY